VKQSIVRSLVFLSRTVSSAVMRAIRLLIWRYINRLDTYLLIYFLKNRPDGCSYNKIQHNWIHKKTKARL